MPKRPNPFGEIAPIQFKTHVGVKEVDRGSRQEELMKCVYEKTQEKLFSGARRSNDINDNTMQSLAVSVQSPLEAATRFEPRQSLLDSNGCLISPIPVSSPVWTLEQGDEGSMQCGQGIQHNGEHHAHTQEARFCGQFSSWLSSSNNGRCNPALGVPASLGSGQLCLDSHGELTAPQDIAMDCDTDTAVSQVEGQGKTQSCGGGGGLLKYGFTSVQHTSKTGRKAPDVCGTCHRLPGSVRCQFCERPVCRGCSRQCDVCSDNFCQLCSTLNYDMAVERAFCLSCVSNVG